MPLSPKPRMDVVRREDKQSRLNAFIAQHLETSVQGAGRWLLVARSPLSPVVLALASLAGEIERAGIKIDAILADPTPAAAETFASDTIGFAEEIRIARNARLLDAHEQLYLDRTTSWVGDCLRRDPTQRDAYECHATNCAERARWTKLSFERLWRASEPVVPPASPAAVADADPAIESAITAAATDAASSALAATRH